MAAPTPYPNNGEHASGQHPASAETATLAELHTTLEELRVTEEELRTQNDELQAARLLVEAERARYQALFEFAPDAYLVTTPHGAIREANRAAAELLNVKQEHLLGKPLVLYIARDCQRAFREQLLKLPTDGVRMVWETRLAPRRKSEVDGLLSVGMERDAKGKLLGLRWLLRDVTEQKQAERLAAIGQMVAGLAHESRNALQRATSCLQRLRWRLEEQPEALDLINRIQTAHDDLGRLFNDVRGYAQVLHLELEICDLAEIWRSVWDNLNSAREGRDACLEENTAGLELDCIADPFRLRQVFRNVLENALAACSDPVRIAIRCEEAYLEDIPAVRVAVRDNGPGLSDEQRQKIFEPFYTTKTRGTGLGMAIAKRIIEAHGGEIAVGASAAPGTEIQITLPLRTR